MVITCATPKLREKYLVWLQTPQHAREISVLWIYTYWQLAYLCFILETSTHGSYFPWIWRQKLKAIKLRILSSLGLLCPYSVKLLGFIDIFFLFQSTNIPFTWFFLYIGLHKKIFISVFLWSYYSLSLSHQVCKSMKYSASVPSDKILPCNESCSLNWWWWLEIYLSQLFTNSLHSSFILSSSSGIHGLLTISCQFHQKGVQLQCTKVIFKL